MSTEPSREPRALDALLELLRPAPAEPSAEGGRVEAEAADRVGPFEIRGHFGGGGMGEVWDALDTRSGSHVALKVPSPEIAEDPKGRLRFLAEAEVLTRLAHPGIVAMLESGEDQGVPWLAMEAIDGASLSRICGLARSSRGPVDAALERLAGSGGRRRGRGTALDRCVVEWTRQVAEALAYAHERGVLHRDIAPANILVDRDGRARLIDFGLARRQATPGLSVAGDVFGTPGYIAPELWAGVAVQASDVFALGAVLFEALTGHRAYGDQGVSPGAPDAGGVAATSVLVHRPDLGARLDRICRMALAWSAQSRYGTARAFAEDLRNAQSGGRVHAPAPPILVRVRERLARRPVRARLEIALASALALVPVAVLARVGVQAVADLRDADAAQVADRVRGEREIESVRAEMQAVPADVWRRQDEHVIRLVRNQRYGAAARLGEWVDEVSRGMEEAAARVWRSAGDVEGLEAAVQEMLRIGDLPALSPEARRALDAARQRIESQAGRRLESVLDRAVDDAIGEYGDSRLETFFAALPRLGDPERAIACLSRYLRAERDERRASLAGAALAELSASAHGAPAAGAVLEAARRFSIGGLFWNRAVLQLAGSDDALATALPAPDEVRPAFGGRRVNGELRDPSGAWLLDPQFVDSWLGLGLPRDGERISARDLADAQLAVELEPGNAAAWAMLGRAMARAGRLGDATAAYLAAIDRDSLDPRIWLERGGARRLAGDVLGAVRDFERATTLRPESARHWAELAMARNDGGDRSGAIDAATKALQIEPDATGGLTYRGMALLCAGDAAGAIQDFARVAEVSPLSAEAQHCLGCAYTILGEVERAVNAQRGAVEVFPSYALAWNGLGVALARRADAAERAGERDRAAADRAEAEAALTDAIDRDRALPFAWNNRGVVRLRQGRAEDAASDFTAAILRAPRLPHGYLGRAIARATSGDRVAAVADARRFLMLSPNDPQAQAARAILTPAEPPRPHGG